MKDDSPLVSVIITAFNEEKQISEALNSVLHQTYSHFELLVFTDGCTDQTASIVKKMAEKDSRIVCIESKENVGKGFGRNTLMKQARGEYLAIFDADDYMYSERLEKQVAFFLENPDIAVLGTQLEYIHHKTKASIITSFPLHHNSIWSSPFKGIPIANPAAMIRKEVFGPCEFKLNLPYAQDYDFWFQSNNQGFKFANLNEVLVKYTWNPTPPWRSIKYQLKVKFYWLFKGKFSLFKSLFDIFSFLASVAYNQLKFWLKKSPKQ